VKAHGAACVLVTHSMRAAGSADRVQRLTAHGVAPDAAAGLAAAPVGDAAAGSGPA
jgi:ABC-type lipoprotein export system ATPase subunit